MAGALGAAASVRAETTPSVSSGLVPRPRPTIRAVAKVPSLQLGIDSPADGALVGDPGGMAFISGRALAQGTGIEAFDIMFVVDQSGSTSVPSGTDVNQDGQIDASLCRDVPRMLSFAAMLVRQCRSPEDSILAAELSAVRTLLRQLDPRWTHAGVVGFSGGVGDDANMDAFVASPLTADYARVEQALQKIESIGPVGSTNMEAGVAIAANELIRSQSAFTSLRKAPRQVMLFMSDGVPTLPFPKSIRKNRQLAVAAASRAAGFGIRMDTFGVGAEALSQPETLVEMADLTMGSFTPVLDPSDLSPIFQLVNFAGVDVLRVVNRTSGAEAGYMMLDADGAFSALVEMVPGDNSIEVYARSKDGSEAMRQISLRFMPGAATPKLSARLVAQRNRLMASRLDALRNRTLAISAQAEEELRRELRERIEQARKQAEQRMREVQVEADQQSPPGRE